MDNDKFGKHLIEAINDMFEVDIPCNTSSKEDMGDLIDEIVVEFGYGYCPACNRIDPENISTPVYNEGYL